MKGIVFGLGCMVAAWSFTPQSAAAQPGSGGVSFNVFYDGLSPYGEWVSAGSGVYGWRPVRVASDWRPYTVGRWAWTDDGWYWVSDEPWGWASYHYGRWTYDDYYGWIWIPGYDWAPAWVEWRYGDDCVGWAPLSPYAVFSVSWGIHYRTRWDTPHSWWSFVDCGNIAHADVHRYVYRNDNNTRFIGRTRTGGSVRYSGGRIVTRGPDREFIERRGNVRIETAKVREVEGRDRERVVRDGNREQIEVYRPRIQERADDRADRPARVREEGGRSVDLDTRKIDVRAREVEREGEFRTRNENGRSAEERVQREERQRNDASNTERQRGTRGDDQRAVQRQPEARPERQNRPERREEVRTPERRMETPQRQRDSAPRPAGGERSEGGRGGRGRG